MNPQPVARSPLKAQQQDAGSILFRLSDCKTQEHSNLRAFRRDGCAGHWDDIGYGSVLSHLSGLRTRPVSVKSSRYDTHCGLFFMVSGRYDTHYGLFLWPPVVSILTTASTSGHFGAKTVGHKICP